MNRSAAAILALVPALFAFSPPAPAQDGGWHYLVQPYLMFPNMKGEAGIAELPPAPVDEDPSDIFNNLQMGAMLYAEAHNQQWMISSDLLYMSLESDVAPGRLVSGGSVEVSQLGWELAAMRRFSEWLELGIGVTYNEIDADVGIFIDTTLGTVSRAAGMNEQWIDPSVVSRVSLPISDKWYFQARANLGGFGVGSDLMWQLQADLGYRHSERMLFTFGYRFIDVDYDHGSGLDRFVYDMQTFGPVLKIGFNF